MTTKNGELVTEIVSVSPQIAAEWLGKMPLNRKLTSSAVDEYTESMRNGLWNMDGSPIRFNAKGELVDGQHRLWAVIESDTTQQFLVVRNVPDQAFLTMDTGRKRTFSDVLSIEYPELPNVLQVAAAARIIYRFSEKEHSLSGVSAGQGRNIANKTLLEYFREHQDEVVAAQRMADNVYTTFPRMLPASKWALLVWMFQSIDLEDSNEFLARLKDGARLDEKSAIFHLRRIFSNEMLNKGRSTLELMALTIKAWNLWREGTEVGVLLLKLGGAHPEPIPTPK